MVNLRRSILLSTEFVKPAVPTTALGRRGGRNQVEQKRIRPITTRRIHDTSIQLILKRANAVLQVRPYFVFLRKATFLELGENEIVIYRDLKSTTIGRYYDKLGDVLLVLLQQGFRQTDGLSDVTSTCAIFELYFLGHGLLLCDGINDHNLTPGLISDWRRIK